MKIKKHKSFINLNRLKRINDKKEKYKEKIARFLEIPTEIIGDNTRLSMVENKMLYFEGKNKIEDYYSHFIKIKTNKNTIIIDGKNMVIKEMGDNELVIEGEIFCINYN
ncbi:MAG: hypothetical protein IKV94_04120 [Clostridia bacterium]|nr:hypothetical protein [Clostridia bacterium]